MGLFEWNKSAQATKKPDALVTGANAPKKPVVSQAKPSADLSTDPKSMGGAVLEDSSEHVLELVNNLRKKKGYPPIKDIFEMEHEIAPPNVVNSVNENKFPSAYESWNKYACRLERAKQMLSAVDFGGKNLLYSPVALETALGVLLSGTSGDAFYQLSSYLDTDFYAGVAQEVMEHAKAISNEEVCAKNGYQTTMKLATSAWLTSDRKLKKEIANGIMSVLDAESRHMSVSDPEMMASVISNWCSRATDGRIMDIVSPEDITKDTAFILCNALFFESGWLSPWAIEQGMFTTADGVVCDLDDMLYDTLSSYYEVSNAVAFSKSYVDGIRFVGILPSEGVQLKDIDIAALLASESNDYDVEVKMPKFDYSYTFESLKGTLKHFGVTSVFDSVDGLDLLFESGDSVSVSDIFQKSRIKLDEHGTEASVAVVVECRIGAVPVMRERKEVHLNRPFYYMILDDITKQVLFIGKVSSV